MNRSASRGVRFTMQIRRSRLTVVGLLVTLIAGLVLFGTAGAAPAPVTGTATGSIGVAGIPVPLPASAAFTGTHDPVSGALKVTVTADDLSLTLPLGADTISVGATFANPGGFTGSASGTTANLNGSIRLTLTQLQAPGVSLPIPIAFLNCSLTFPLALTGTWDDTARVVQVTQPDVTMPTLAPVCATALQLTTQIDVNAILGQLPPGDVTIRLAFDGGTTSTTSTTSTSTSTTSTSTSTTTSTSTPTTTSTTSTTTPTTSSSTTSTSTSTPSASTTTSTPTPTTSTTFSGGTPTVPGARPETSTTAPTPTSSAPETTHPGSTPSTTAVVQSTTGPTLPPVTAATPATAVAGERGASAPAAAGARPISGNATYAG